MFKIGSYVVYKSEGVCAISDVRAEDFGTPGEQYYILTPLNDPKSTLFVPVANEKLTSLMRRLMSAEEINELAAAAREESMEWIADSRSRSNVFKEILALGDRRQLAVLARTLAERIAETLASGKKAGSTETGALRRAERMLYEEFSATTDISSPEDVLPFLRGEITLGAKT